MIALMCSVVFMLFRLPFSLVGRVDVVRGVGVVDASCCVDCGVPTRSLLEAVPLLRRNVLLVQLAEVVPVRPSMCW